MRFALLGLIFTLPTVAAQWDTAEYRATLDSLRKAIRRHATKQQAIAAIDAPHLSRMLNAQARLPLDVIAQADAEIQRDFHFEEILRLGLPSAIRGGLKMARMVLRGQSMKRSA
ncbi:MAG: hypothetical protein M3Q55_02655 [Acidobacteriota bacterium]|nr:hypothetical protein [Acidobacteriota bacterium]